MKPLLIIILLSFSTMATTRYVSPTGSGSACTVGTPCALAFAVGGGSSPVQPGDTVELANGIYQLNNFVFAPGGTSQDVMTIFKAAAGARPILTSLTNTPPEVHVPSYTRLEGLWMGGTRVEVATGIFIGGSPISHWVQIANCTIFGYADGIEGGSAEFYLIHGDRFVHTGHGTFDQSVYASSNDNHDGTESNHGIMDYNLAVAGGGGYFLHWFPANKTGIITRNADFGPGSWGIAVYGKSVLVANNLIWRGYQNGLGCSNGIGITLNRPPNSIAENNVIGLCAGSFLFAEVATHNGFEATDGVCGDACIPLLPADNAANLGLSTADIDNTVAAISASFSQSVETILADTTIETNFAKLRLVTPNSSLLYHAGVLWYDSNPINVGPDSGAPPTVAGFWVAFRALGLKEYDSNGQLYPSSAVSGRVRLEGNARIK